MSEMQVMDQTGHFISKWNQTNPDEVRIARELYENLVGEKGYTAFRVGSGDSKGTRLTAFDPAVEKMILVPQLQGG